MHPLLAEVDWDQEGSAALDLFQRLLRFDTTNPPGHEAACAAFLADWLSDAGVAPRVLEPAPGRANLVTRLAADDDDVGPLLLNAHLDVVGVEADRWTHPPFAGEIHDGFVWGRGAIDMKHMAAMSAVTVALLRRLDVPLRRDVLFAAVADEEAGCGLGSRWLVDHHPDLVRAGYALGEVGGFTLQVGPGVVYPVQGAEKGICWIRARAEGPSAHGSMPRSDSAVVQLAAFLDRLGRRRLRVRRSEPAERFLAGLLEAVLTLKGRALDRRSWHPAGRLRFNNGLIVIEGLTEAIKQVSLDAQVDDQDIEITRLAMKTAGSDLRASGSIASVPLRCR
jgi:acetylornithine deacetylase/succinyl-diaminopimelate desuccinylase-like protein